MGKLTIQSAHKLIEKLKPQMALALPKHITADRLARLALTEMSRVPKLKDCTESSLMKCLMVASQLGLEPGLLGHVYLIPYGKEATLIIGYKGMIDLARRSGQIESIEARVVRQGEVCNIHYGTDSHIHHVIDPFLPDTAKAIGYYAVAKFINGGKQFDFMSIGEIEKCRQSSKSGSSGPWATGHYDEMAKKTVIRRLFKYLPISVEIQQAVNLDEAHESDTQKAIIEGEFFNIEDDTDEEKTQTQEDELMEKIK